MRELDVVIKGKRIHNKDHMDLADVQSIPKIGWNLPANKYYTIVMVDPDAPSHKNPINKHWLHWMMVNNNETKAVFKAPSPPPGTGEHRYFIYLLEQTKQISDVPNFNNKREKFPLETFMKTYGMKPIASVMFTTERN